MIKPVTIHCYDNGGKTADRYTIAISGLLRRKWYEYTYFLGASENPFHPQGFGQHCFEVLTSQFNPNNTEAYGREIGFLDLPVDVQRFVASELMPE